VSGLTTLPTVESDSGQQRHLLAAVSQQLIHVEQACLPQSTYIHTSRADQNVHRDTRDSAISITPSRSAH